MNPALAMLAAGLVTAATAPLAARLARRLGMVNRPKADRWSQRVTPLLGGVAFMAGFLAAALSALPVGDPRVRAVLAGALLLFVVGVLDDRVGMRPSTKLAAQLAAAAILVQGGVVVELPGRLVLGIPLTVFWVVGITNALNLLDNMDGLASGVGAIGALVLAAFGAAAGAVVAPIPWLTTLALCIAGAALGFLPWNVSPARQFLGDAGSLPLGFLLAAAGILGTYRDAGNVFLVLVAPVFVLGVPILDTTLVTLVRKFHGRRVSQGGRDHLSHRLVALGMSERKAVAVLWAVSAGLGAAALLVSPDPRHLPGMGSMVLFGLLAAGAAIFGVVLGEVKVYREVAPEETEAAQGAREARAAFLLHARALAVVFLDLGFIVGALAAAHALHYGGRGEGFDRVRFFEALPAVLVAKLLVLQVFGLQRGLWRYFGLRDLAAVGTAVVSGSLLVVAAARFVPGLRGYPDQVLILDGVLLFLFLVGSRSVFRLVVETLAGFPSDGVPVLLVGAGVEGDLALRSLRIRGGVRPVGILDDDAALRGRRFHGIPILGARAGLADVLRAHPEVREVVLASAPDPEVLPTLRDAVHGAGARLVLAPSAHRFTEI